MADAASQALSALAELLTRAFGSETASLMVARKMTLESIPMSPQVVQALEAAGIDLPGECARYKAAVLQKQRDSEDANAALPDGQRLPNDQVVLVPDYFVAAYAGRVEPDTLNMETATTEMRRVVTRVIRALSGDLGADRAQGFAMGMALAAALNVNRNNANRRDFEGWNDFHLLEVVGREDECE